MGQPRPRPDPELHYTMPPIVGHRPASEGTWYRDVTTIGVTYLAPADKVARLLPDGFEVGAEPLHEPLVSVFYSRNRGVDWLAGGGYNLVGVNVAATFHGEVDHVSGSYCVIMWEDRTEPILGGREQAGIPKVYADITDLMQRDGHLLARASLNGHPIVEVEVWDLQPLPPAETAAYQERARRGNWMGYRYIPRLGGPGAELAQPTLYPSEPEYDLVQTGQGRVRFFPSTFADNPTQHAIINLLCELEPLEYRGAYYSHGRSRLLVGRVRALR